MDEQRKEVIIREIKHWRQSNLLPKHYCDFLLTLYTEGEEELIEPVSKRFLDKKMIFTLIIVQLCFFITTLVIYFTDFSNGLQMLIGLILSTIVFILARRTEGTPKVFVEFCYFISALILFILSMEAVTTVFERSNMALTVVVLLHCVGWVFIGMIKKMRFFSIAGVLGLVVLGIFWIK
ncbi:hypothetical protein [Bacillus sp. FJAT-45037]|uniref:hypothetical protein n=1 Tax=Bacillus sp. FJAT-45037 TaxID=2011007 RepID=UPI000C24E9D4|nr:hypothetical protein [Bacillus sp. FJAT-45037]